jgi:hypothetical protein
VRSVWVRASLGRAWELWFGFPSVGRRDGVRSREKSFRLYSVAKTPANRVQDAVWVYYSEVSYDMICL